MPPLACAGLLDSAEVRWCEALADGAGTSPERVAVQCVHQHNAPFACLDAQTSAPRMAIFPGSSVSRFFQRVWSAAPVYDVHAIGLRTRSGSSKTIRASNAAFAKR